MITIRELGDYTVKIDDRLNLYYVFYGEEVIGSTPLLSFALEYINEIREMEGGK